MREMKSTLFSAFYVGILFIAGVTGRITNPPLNAAAEVRSQAIFNCTSDTNLQIWYLSRTREEIEGSTPTGQSIISNCVVESGFATHYDVDRPGGNNNKCNLIIKAITMQQAGVYTCSDGLAGPSAVLTVIDRNASITVSSQSETVEGETVTMSYTVNYNTSTASSKTPTIQPVLSWTDSNGNTVTGSPSSTATSITSSISVTAGRQDIRPHTCHIDYEVKLPSPLPSGLTFASNTLNSVSNPPNTSNINVLYPPTISTITMSQEVAVCPGKTIVKFTCHATANPEPTYSWIGPNSRTYSGETIEAVVNGTYNCNASNIIRGSVRSDMKERTLNVLCSLWFLLLLWVLNPIAAAIFVNHYKTCSQVRNDYNERYLFLDKMLPCMNNSQETPYRKAGWITLFIVMVIFSGIQFLILAIATYVGCKNKVRDTKNEPRKAGKSSDQNQSTNFTSEEQSNSSQSNSSQSNLSHATGTKCPQTCFALALAYMILGIILFAISVGVISYECNKQCNKR